MNRLLLLLAFPLLSYGQEIKVSEWHNSEPVSLKGKIIVIDFWATWCKPCIQSFPHMDSLKSQYGDSLIFLAMTKETGKKVSGFVKKLNTNLNFVSDTYGETWKNFNIKSIPQTFVIKEGRMLWEGRPNQLDKKLLDNLLKGISIEVKEVNKEFDFSSGVMDVEDSYANLYTPLYYLLSFVCDPKKGEFLEINGYEKFNPVLDIKVRAGDIGKDNIKKAILKGLTDRYNIKIKKELRQVPRYTVNYQNTKKLVKSVDPFYYNTFHDAPDSPVAPGVKGKMNIGVVAHSLSQMYQLEAIDVSEDKTYYDIDIEFPETIEEITKTFKKEYNIILKQEGTTKKEFVVVDIKP